ncbi:hypothetical protein J3R08_002200 [Micromonospora sp. HB375]|uniref:hypothetical protein n=1 Tax=Micromonospora TaxID=1873 RepID=UPI001AE24CAF|nr:MULTISPECIES: hypothetical protein [unclassified Micromonospora]MBP1782350.1 hypothetical protein [Micromonospora sp. HB375]MBQ1062377.1 hypothetical protein [Micromonospora sp. C41]MDH6468214.1 hypothetical protein [Micromonospora sp. H404/HB375]
MDASGLDQETVERLLAGRPGDTSSAPPGLVAVLAAVRTAPGTGELDGEAAAVAGFREARRARRRRRVRFGVRVAVSALAASLTGGVALAATGNLPHVARPAATPVDAAPPVPSARPALPALSPATRAAQQSAPPGLCVAYRALAEADRGRALETPAFSDLVAAAGGHERVPDYCAALLGDDDPPGKADGGRGGGRSAHPVQPSVGPPGADVLPPGQAKRPDGTPPGRRTG